MAKYVGHRLIQDQKETSNGKPLTMVDSPAINKLMSFSGTVEGLVILYLNVIFVIFVFITNLGLFVYSSPLLTRMLLMFLFGLL